MLEIADKNTTDYQSKISYNNLQLQSLALKLN